MVGFVVILRGPERLEEAELPARADELRGVDPLSGAIVIAGDPVVEIADELPALVEHVCFRAPGELSNGRAVGVSYFDKPGGVRFVPDGASVRISGDYVPEAVVPGAELVDGLVACGERAVAFLTSLGGVHAEIAAELGPRS